LQIVVIDLLIITQNNNL